MKKTDSRISYVIPEIEYIALRLRELRRLKGYTQNSLAKKLGYSKSMISKLENSEGGLNSVLYIIEFCRELDIGIEDVLEGIERMSTTQIEKKLDKKSRSSMKIFISYSRQDATLADKLCKDLKEFGYDPFIDRNDLPTGEWPDYLEKAIQDSQYILLLVTKSSAASINVKQEVMESPKKVIPLIFEKLDLRENFGNKIANQNGMDFLDYQKSIAELPKFLERINSKLPEQLAAVCYRIVEGEIQLLLPKTNSGRRTFAKGGRSRGLKDIEVVEKEAYEEAGVVTGNLDKKPFSYYIHEKKGLKRDRVKKFRVHAYLYHVEISSNAPEPRRDPEWFSIKEAKNALYFERSPLCCKEFSNIIDKAVKIIKGRHRNENQVIEE